MITGTLGPLTFRTETFGEPKPWGQPVHAEPSVLWTEPQKV